MKRAISFLILILFIGGIIFLFNEEILNFYFRIKKNALLRPERLEETIRNYVKNLEHREILPPPLRAEEEFEQSFLSTEGIIKWTNFWREKNGLPPLKENEKLNLTAKMKVEDMFVKQYFNHYSPTGEGVKDLAEKAGYRYILIGENLAMGNFLNDERLVKEWMESPDHRENILNPRYQEIGIAVKKGIFMGETTWIAVQHFGLPLSFCPSPDENLKMEIEEGKNKLKEMIEKLDLLEEEINQFKSKRREELKEKIEEYNTLAREYNVLLENVRSLVNTYNSQVDIFNRCVVGE